MENQCKVTVVDSICGSGKTSWAINYMNDNTDKKFIYITPYLDEIQRVLDSCDNRAFFEPKTTRGEGSKLKDFNKLLSQGKNIISTHALFSMVNDDTLKYLKENNYILILDEVFSVCEQIQITKSDREILLRDKISVDEKGKLTWIDKNYKGTLTKYKNAIEQGDVYIFDEIFMLWTFPCRIMETLEHTYILTYLFKGQMQRNYYDMNEIQYEYKAVKRINETYEIVEYNEYEDLTYLQNLIHICDDKKLNKIGESSDKRVNPLSKSWYEKQLEENTDAFDVLSKNMVNYFRNICKGKSKDNMWTTFKDFKNKCKGEGYTKGFVSCNARATNEYRHKKNLAYIINAFYNPMIIRFFKEKSVEVDVDSWSLSELIQWMFRSQLRDNKEINLYIPSSRMRDLLKKWLYKF